METTATISWIWQSATTACTFSRSAYEFDYAETARTTATSRIFDDTDYHGQGTIISSADKSSDGKSDSTTLYAVEVSCTFTMGTSTEAD